MFSWRRLQAWEPKIKGLFNFAMETLASLGVVEEFLKRHA
jgi:hypothetical protein